MRLFDRLICDRERVRKGLIVIIGTLLMAIAVNCVFEPMHLVTGGVTGIGIIVKEVTGDIVDHVGIPIWVTNLICNIPLFYFAYRIMGKRFVKQGLMTTTIFTLFLAIIPITKPLSNSLLLTAVFGGEIMGLGLGLIFRTGTTTGGMDLLATMIRYKAGRFSEAKVLAVLDGAIVILGADLFGLRPALYAILAIIVTAVVSDSIVDSRKLGVVIGHNIR